MAQQPYIPTNRLGDTNVGETPIPEHFLKDQRARGHLPMDPGHQAFLRKQTARTLGSGTVNTLYGGPGVDPEEPASLDEIILLLADQIMRNTDQTGATAILPYGGSPDMGGPTPLGPSNTGREVEALRRKVNPTGPVGRRTAGISSRTGF